MNDNHYLAGIYSTLLGWIVLTTAWMSKKVSKNDFQIFRKEMREDMKGIHERLDTFIERRHETRE